MMGELYTVHEMPEQPKEGFFKGLFGGGAKPLDREELCTYIMGRIDIKNITLYIKLILQLVNRVGKQFVPLHGIYPVPIWISLVNVLPQPHRKLAVRISWPWSVARSSIYWRSAPSVWPIQLKISAVQRIN